MPATRNVCHQLPASVSSQEKMSSTSWRWGSLTLPLTFSLMITLTLTHSPSPSLSCTHSLVLSPPSHYCQVCPEKGLTDQQFRCFKCNRAFNQSPSVEPRLCDYDGLYYCSHCHNRDTAVIPARVMHNWDFTAREVSTVGHWYTSMVEVSTLQWYTSTVEASLFLGSPFP